MAKKVKYYIADVSFRIEKKKTLGNFIEDIFNRENTPFDSLSFVFCSDEYLLNINRDFLQHDYYTDIITFDLSDVSSNSVVGEVYISIDRVKENATNNGTTFKEELMRVIFHGVLHLCGYKDKSKRDVKVMREKEEENLLLYLK